MNKKKDKLIGALEMMEIETNEFTHPSMTALEELKNIKVTDKKAVPYHRNQMAFWVEAPYDPDEFSKLEKQAKVWLPPNVDVRSMVKRSGNKMMYVQNVDIADVDAEILDDLCNIYKVCDVNGNEIEKYINRTTIRDTIAKEIIASRLAKRKELST